MSILSRLTLRNILGKPMRSLAIIIALAASAFAMLFCIAGRKAPEQGIRQMLLDIYGGAEIVVFDKNCDLSLDAADLPKDTKLLYIAKANVTASSSKGEWAAITTNFDAKLAKKMSLTQSEYDEKGGVIVSKAFADKAGLSQGDSLKLAGDSETLELTVTQISDDKYLMRNSTHIFMSFDNVKKLGSYTGSGYNAAYIDVPNDTDVTSLTADLVKKYPDHMVDPLLNDDMLESINNQTMVFYLIFAIILLMTLFLTFSMSRHIANERISTIGTLRSLGGSIAKTSGVLIIESGFYGLAGGILGVILFLLLGRFAVAALTGLVDVQWDMSLIVYPLAIVFAVVLQLVCQTGALVKAVRTPVRDIIFSSRDTAYHLSIKKVIIGAVILGAGVTLGMFSDDVVMSIAAITLVCVGSVMVMPIVLKLLSKLFVKLFGACGLSCAKLAAGECAYKKSTVASTQLTFVALAITTAVFITAGSISQLYDKDVFQFDARIDAYLEEAECEKLVDMPQITQHQNLMESWIGCTVNGGKRMDISILAHTDFKLYTAVKGLGEEPAKGEAYIGDTFAKKLGVNVGDTISVQQLDSYNINEDGKKEYPDPFKLKIKGTCNTVQHYNNTIIVNKQWYIDNLGDNVTAIYINLGKPSDFEQVRTQIEKAQHDVEVETAEEIVAMSEQDRSSVMSILYTMTAVGCILALLGAASNAVIGFEQSRRKYAVLHSVAASKRKLSKLILLETLFSALTAGVLALIMGVLLSSLISTTLSSMSMGIEVIYDIPTTAAFVAILIAVLLIAAVKPIFSLRKMNTAAELKYE